MRVYLRLNGNYIGVEPGKTLVHTRSVPGAWEEVELTPHPSGKFDVKFVVSGLQLSMTPVGLESRPPGVVGEWETMYATQQPDGSAFLYRLQNGNLVNVLTIEAK